MKSKIEKLKSEIKVVIAPLVLIALFVMGAYVAMKPSSTQAAAITVPSQAVAFPKVYTSQFTNAPGGLLTNGVTFTLRGGTTTNINSTWIRLFRGRGFSVFFPFIGPTVAVSNVIYKFNVSYDGTNATTTTPLSYTVSANGATGVTGWTNFFPDTADNVFAVQLASIQSLNLNGTNLTLTNPIVQILPN